MFGKLKLTANWFKSRLPVTLNDLRKMEKRIMSAISEAAATMNANLDAARDEVEKLKESQVKIGQDVDFIKAKLDEINNNPGPITPEDQILLNALIARTAGLRDSVKEQAEVANTIDSKVQPVVVPPVEPPPPVEPLPTEPPVNP